MNELKYFFVNSLIKIFSPFKLVLGHTLCKLYRLRSIYYVKSLSSVELHNLISEFLSESSIKST